MHQQHREKLCKALSEESGIVLIKGGKTSHRYETDFEYPFRQESNFLYLTGCHGPDFHLMIDLSDKSYTLFAPKRDTQFAVWMGYVPTADELNEKYKPDFLKYDDELETELKKRAPEMVYCLNADQAGWVSAMGFKTNDNLLKDAMAWCRCTKSEWELNQLRAASRVASLAHVILRQNLKEGLYEYELKALYDYECVSRGLLHNAYNGIFASGASSAILHYTENNRKLEPGGLFLVDAGAEYNGYAADITRTYPINGKFSPLQAELYETCLSALDGAIAACKPGVKMIDLHLNAARTILSGLKGIGLVYGDVDELMEKNIFALFFPHGLGHFLGLDTHDVGGYPKGVEPVDRPGLRFLRAHRTLEPGMVITIEPGLYFIPALLKPAFKEEGKKEFLNVEKLSTMLGFGGYRIEDNIIITGDGFENMTNVPKKLNDVSA